MSSSPEAKAAAAAEEPKESPSSKASVGPKAVLPEVEALAQLAVLYFLLDHSMPEEVGLLSTMLEIV